MQRAQSQLCFGKQPSFESIVANPSRRVGDEFLAKIGGHAARQRGQLRRAYLIKKVACSVSLEQRINGRKGAQGIVGSRSLLQGFRQNAARICLFGRAKQSAKRLLTCAEANPYTQNIGGAPACAANLGDPQYVRSDNKLARLAKERREKLRSAGVEDEPTIEDQLVRVEEDIRRLKVEFDIYFNGGAKRPPYDTKLRLESHLKRLGDDRAMSFAQRYHFNSLATRYASFRELWRRILQDREEGRGTAGSRAAVREPSQFVRSEFSCTDVRHDVRTVKGVYDALMEAKRSCGESSRDLTFSKFHRLVMERTNALKEQFGSDRVTFSVDVDNGHVSFKAKIDK